MSGSRCGTPSPQWGSIRNSHLHKKTEGLRSCERYSRTALESRSIYPYNTLKFNKKWLLGLESNYSHKLLNLKEFLWRLSVVSPIPTPAEAGLRRDAMICVGSGRG